MKTFLAYTFAVVVAAVIFSGVRSQTGLSPEEVLDKGIVALPNETVCRREIKDIVKGVYAQIQAFNENLDDFKKSVEERREKEKYRG